MIKTQVFKSGLQVDKIKRTQATRGQSLLTTGGPTSAGKLNRRTGLNCPDSMVTVEGGKRIHERELWRSVKDAAERFLRMRGKGYA